MWQNFSAIGNLGDSPQMRYTPSGVAVASFSMAINRNWTDGNGVKQSKTLWVRVSAWRKLAELTTQYLVKGSKILLVGEIEEARPYTDREGNARASLEVTAQTIKFLDTKGEGGETAHPAPATRHPVAQEESPFTDENIPF